MEMEKLGIIKRTTEASFTNRVQDTQEKNSGIEDKYKKWIHQSKMLNL